MEYSSLVFVLIKKALKRENSMIIEAASFKDSKLDPRDLFPERRGQTEKVE